MAKDNVSGKGNTYTLRGDEEFDDVLRRAQKIHKKEKYADLFRSAVESAAMVQIVQSPAVLDVSELLLSTKRLTISVPDLSTWLRVHGHWKALAKRILSNGPTYFILAESDKDFTKEATPHIRSVAELYKEGTMGLGPPDEANFALCLTAAPTSDFIVQFDDRVLYCPELLFPELGFLFWRLGANEFPPLSGSQEKNRFCTAIEKYLDDAVTLFSNYLILDPYSPEDDEQENYVGERFRRGPFE